MYFYSDGQFEFRVYITKRLKFRRDDMLCIQVYLDNLFKGSIQHTESYEGLKVKFLFTENEIILSNFVFLSLR